jgi:hypothetical protein
MRPGRILVVSKFDAPRPIRVQIADVIVEGEWRQGSGIVAVQYAGLALAGRETDAAQGQALAERLLREMVYRR